VTHEEALALFFRGDLSCQAGVLQVGLDFSRALVPKVTVLLQRLADDSLHFWRKLAIELRGCNRLAVQDGVKDHSRRVASKRHLSGCHFVQHRAEREQITARVQLPSAHLLGRHVGYRSHRGSRACQVLVRNCCRCTCLSDADGIRREALAAHLRQAKVQDFCVAAACHENIGRLDVAVDDALGVGRIECIGDLDGELQHGFQIQRPAHDHGL
jgi:hypothetical protein